LRESRKKLEGFDLARCEVCGADLALVGRVHRCVGGGGSITNAVVSKKKSVTNMDTNKDRPTSTARVTRWKAAHRRSWNEYMKLYMRDWRCRRATLRSSDG
jgi:hypothetical protein